MTGWETLACFIPILALIFWQASRIDKLERKLWELGSKFDEARDQAQRNHMLHAIEQVLAEDDEAREVHGLPPHDRPKVNG